MNVPIGALQVGEDWQAAADAVRACIRVHKDTVPKDYSELVCSLGHRHITLQVSRYEDVGDGLTVVGRYGRFDVDATVRIALERKLPKLVATAADKRILMLERDQFKLAPNALATAVETHRPNFPLLASVDEIWIAEAHEDRRIVLFDLLRRDGRYAPIYVFREGRLYSRHDR